MSQGDKLEEGVRRAMGIGELEDQARQIRRDIIEMVAAAGSGHPGGSLSGADIATALFFGGILDYDAGNPKEPSRDRFILSKGHAAPLLYATLARAGYFDPSELQTLRKFGSRLQGHPDSKKLPGVEVCTGSLGQGLSISAGLALGLSMAGGKQQVFTLLGDGELQEGSVWEAAMFAASRSLGNLVAIIDNNNLQIDGANADVCDLGSIPAKFEAFGWHVIEVDGHDMGALLDVLCAAKAYTAGPVAVVAHTIKGKGVSFMENQAGWHGKAPNAEQAAQALSELSDEGAKEGNRG